MIEINKRFPPTPWSRSQQLATDYFLYEELTTKIDELTELGGTPAWVTLLQALLLPIMGSPLWP